MAAAQDDAAPSAERITVTGTRIIRSGMVTPTPVTAVGTEELETLSSGTLLEGLSELPNFFANLSPEQVNGGQNAGGSNVNLRGAGANRTLVLLDGRRMVPSNRFGTVDVAMIPSELLRSVETVTGGASASYGTDAVAGVVNFILDTDFEGFKGHAQYGETRYGDGQNYEAAGAFGVRVGERGHLLASLEHFNQNPISDFDGLDDRTFFQHRARVTNPGYNGTTNPNVPQNLILPYVVPTNWNNTGMIIQPGAAINRSTFNPDGTISPFVFSGVGAVGSGCNCMALSSPSHGVDSDDEVLSANKRTSGFLYYEHDVTDSFRIYGQILAGRNETDDRRENISFILTWMPRIFADNAYLPSSTAALINSQGSIVAGSNNVRSVGYALFGINNGSVLPDARQITINELLSGTVGFEWELGDAAGPLNGWTVNGYYQVGENDQSFDTENGIRVDRIPLALDAVRHPQTNQIVCHVAIVDPANFGDCVPMNIFGGLSNLTPAAIDYIVDDYKTAIQHTTQDFAEVVASGDLFDGFGAGPVSGAVGASYRKETLDQRTVDPTDEFPATRRGTLLSDIGLLPPDIRGLVQQNGMTGPTGFIPGIPGVRNVPTGFAGDNNSSSVTFSSLRAISGEYDVTEAFTELNVPLLAGLPLVEQLDVNGALRWADYSSGGEVWAWKVGASWQIVDDLRLRATQSRDVRAPTLRELFDQTRGGVNVTDPLNGNAVISTASLSGGNQDLVPEEADTITVGAVFQPSFVDSLSMSLDWYQIEISDAINQLGAQTVVTNCANGDTFLCQFVLRDSANTIVRVDNLFFNVDTQIIEGIDFEASYSFQDFNFRLFATQLLENSVENINGVIDDRAGDIGTQGMPELKVTANLSYSRGPFTAFLQERYIDGGLIDRTVREGVGNTPGVITVNDNHVPETFYTDIGASWALQDGQWEIYGTVDNLLDQEPRATPGVVGRAGTTEFNRSVYDVLGRRYTVGVRMAF